MTQDRRDLWVFPVREDHPDEEEQKATGVTLANVALTVCPESLD